MNKVILKKKLYLDVCTLCRPFDNQHMMRIRLEADAFYLILENIKDNNYDMVVSPVHFKEIEAIEDPHERFELISLLNKFGIKPSYNLRKVRDKAEYFFNHKFGVADAAHLAFAEEGADVFITCDDKILKICKKVKVRVLTLNPIEFCLMENLK